jgi:hypothetical protein
VTATAAGRAGHNQRVTGKLRLPDGSRSVQSVWVWRGFLFMSLIALGLCLTFAVGGRLFYTAAWAVIAIGWFVTSMWLWRQHVRWDDSAWAKRQGARPGSGRGRGR